MATFDPRPEIIDLLDHAEDKQHVQPTDDVEWADLNPLCGFCGSERHSTDECPRSTARSDYYLTGV